MLLAPAMGAGLGFVLLINVVLPAIGVGSVERIVQLGRHLDAPLAAGAHGRLCGQFDHA